MKVQMLGSSAAEGVPGLFCRCEVCGRARRQGGKDIRTRTTTLIDGLLKIDFPPDTLGHVIKYNLDLRCLGALLFTHAHDDHCSAGELQYIGQYFVPKPIAEPFPVYGPIDVIQRIKRDIEVERTPIELHTLHPWQTESIAGYAVTPVVAQHDPLQTCFNYLIQDSDGATLLYATDTGWYHERTWSYLESVHIDAIIVECAKGPQEGGYAGHLCIPEVIAMRERLIRSGSFPDDGLMVTTHFSHLGGMMHADLEEALNPHGIEVGYDGMVFRLEAEE